MTGKEDAVMRFVYNAFYGRYSDSPRAIYERLLERGGDHEHIWLAAADHQHGFSAQTSTVAFGSAEGVAALESADVIVSNTFNDVEWTKAPGAVYLQTWHGTPLKRIHHDIFAVSTPGDLLERLDRDVVRWDYLVSPNRASTERLRNAFRFPGDVLETGYPRNDLLLAPDREQRRADVRAQLGLADHTTAVLYTPTWRDDDYFAEDQADITLALDGEHFAARMGEDWCLLPRLHYYMSGRMAPLQGPGVRDVSFYPDIRDLYLAADVMVTDYSSTMFDFAITGKPMIFYAYDLPRYRDSLRGLYFDFVPDAPGPVLETAPAVLDALADLDGVRAEYAARYTAFQRLYCYLEDGHATDRVIDAVLGGR
jgi:CDP-glycerol glycerophosphotransferase